MAPAQGGESASKDLIKITKHLLAGGIAGAVSRTVVSPLERLKILFQVLGPGQTPPGVITTLREIYRAEGIKGYFKGNGTNVLRIAPYSAVQFASYEKYKAWVLLYTGNESLDTVGRLFAGACAGITSASTTYPLDMVRTRLSLQEKNPRYKGIADALKVIYKEEGGILALYRGLFPTLMGVAPYVAINFMVYETLRGFFAIRSETGSPSVFQKLLCGALAGAAAQTVTYPMDVVRRRMQIAGMPGNSFAYPSTYLAFKTIFLREGLRGFFKGMIPNYLKVAPATGVSFVSYEWSKKILGTT